MVDDGERWSALTQCMGAAFNHLAVSLEEADNFSAECMFKKPLLCSAFKTVLVTMQWLIWQS